MREANLKGCGSREGFLTRAIEGWLRFDSLSLSLSARAKVFLETALGRALRRAQQPAPCSPGRNRCI